MVSNYIYALTEQSCILVLKIMPFYFNLIMWRPRAGNPGTCSHCDCQTQTVSLTNSYNNTSRLVTGSSLWPFL